MSTTILIMLMCVRTTVMYISSVYNFLFIWSDRMSMTMIIMRLCVRATVMDISVDDFDARVKFTSWYLFENQNCKYFQ